jgi:hypothetical protein
MLNESILASCAQLPSPVLSVSVNTSERSADRHPRVRPELTWLSDAADKLGETLGDRERKSFERQVRRVRRFLEHRRAAERAAVIFAGPKCWRVSPLHVSVQNKLHWGEPEIASLLPLFCGHRSYGIVVLDHKTVRYFASSRGDLTLLGSRSFEIDASQWKHKYQGRVGAERVQKSRGPLRDLYQRRIEAQYKKLCHQVADEAAAMAKRHELDGLLLVGPDRLIQFVREKIPYSLVDTTVVVQENLGRSSLRELQRRLQPLVDDHEQEQQLSGVRLLQSSDRAAITNPDEVIAQLQTGRIRTLLVARDLEFALRQCPKCKQASRAADRVCADCGELRQEINLGELLAQVSAMGDVNIEFVNGVAAQLLLRTGGLGGWLRARSAAAAV